MPCFHPLPAYRTKAGEVRVGWMREESERLREFQLPCGTCLGCMKSYARSWAIRNKWELRYPQPGVSGDACWCTLTYDDAHVPPTLQPSHLSLFMRKLRKRNSSRRIRHFSCGEYGERTFRPHYHAILYGVSEDIDIQSSWPYGFAQTHTLTDAAIAYVAGYCSKKLGFKVEAGERVDLSTGEVYEFQPPFLQMSKKPGIGAAARDTFWRSWKRRAIDSGREVPVPRYLHNKWKAEAPSEEVVALQLEKEEDAWLHRHERTPEKLRSAEIVALKSHSLSAERRTL